MLKVVVPYARWGWTRWVGLAGLVAIASVCAGESLAAGGASVGVAVS